MTHRSAFLDDCDIKTVGGSLCMWCLERELNGYSFTGIRS